MTPGLSKLLEATSAKTLAPRNGHVASYKGLCPVHGDTRPSLDIDVSGDGKTLIICRACPAKPSQIIEAIGLSWDDFGSKNDKPFPVKSKPKPSKVFTTAAEAVKDYEKKHGKKKSAYWTYEDESGKRVGVVVRWDKPDGRKDDVKPVSLNGQGWVQKAMPVPRPLYQLPSLKDATLVIVCEGEKATDAARNLGFIATTSAGGCKAAKQSDWSPLAGKQVVILPDNDKSGEGYLEDVCKLLAKLNPSPQVKIVRLPDLPPTGDCADFVATRMVDGLSYGDIRAEIEKLIATADSDGGLTNYRTEQYQEGDKIKERKIGLSADVIAKRLLAQTDGWPKACDGQLFYRNGNEVVFLDEPSPLFAFVNNRIGSGEDCPIDWVQGSNKITKSEFFEYLRGHVEQFEGISGYPNWPTIPATYYTHDPLPEPDGKSLEEFVSMFSPATDEDGELIKAFVLTAFWGGPAGKRPGFLIDVEAGDPHGGRGVGKTTLVEKIAALIGGVIRISSRESSEDLCKRLLSPSARNRRVVLLDNAKSLKLSSADLEGLVTADTISGRQLFVGEGRRPNHMLWCITVNAASVSKDLAQRFIPIALKRCKKSADWEKDIDQFIRTKSGHIAADAIAILKQPGNRLSAYTRWAVWEDAILSKLKEPSDLQLLIADRQDAVDGDREEADAVRYELRHFLEGKKINPDCSCVFLPGQSVAEVVQKVSQERRTVTSCTRYLKCLNIREIYSTNHGKFGRGFAWRGEKTSPSDILHHIDEFSLKDESQY